MKLVVLATLIAVCTAGRLENLERSYLPPENRISSVKHGNSVGSFGTSLESEQGNNARNSFTSASNRYLPPGKESINDISQFIADVKDFGVSGVGSSNQQYSFPRTPYGTSQGSGAFNVREKSQFSPLNQYLTPKANQNEKFEALSRQYLAPNAGSAPNSRHQQSGSLHGNGRQRFGSSSGSQYQQFGAVNQLSQNQQFGSAASRQYLTPRAGSSQSTTPQQFVGSNVRQQLQFETTPRRQYLTPQINSFQSNRQQQFVANGRQYLAPHSSGSQKQQTFGHSNVGQQQNFGSNLQHFAPDAEEYVKPERTTSQLASVSHQRPYSSGLQNTGGTHYNKMNGNGLGEPSRQYLAPRINVRQGVPQQPFNERTGYQY